MLWLGVEIAEGEGSKSACGETVESILPSYSDLYSLLLLKVQIWGTNNGPDLTPSCTTLKSSKMNDQPWSRSNSKLYYPERRIANPEEHPTIYSDLYSLLLLKVQIWGTNNGPDLTPSCTTLKSSKMNDQPWSRSNSKLYYPSPLSPILKSILPSYSDLYSLLLLKVQIWGTNNGPDLTPSCTTLKSSKMNDQPWSRSNSKLYYPSAESPILKSILPSYSDLYSLLLLKVQIWGTNNGPDLTPSCTTLKSSKMNDQPWSRSNSKLYYPNGPNGV
ncbi:hypothetical protein GWK47_029115 [Chionoecetes opilio]|uniref:Uncharacterized protein n=1 Tax=Chionoecetes opilio TaxID=41210 RepID=A0A8J4Z4F9_CHIOP|nr:hypothetical protein GWK47_029115 [Chionoecetes opilio]